MPSLSQTTLGSAAAGFRKRLLPVRRRQRGGRARTAGARVPPPWSGRRPAPRCAQLMLFAGLAVGTMTTARFCRLRPRAMRRSSMCARSDQCAADAQPLSTTIATGPLPASAASREGLSTGSASARMTSAAASRRMSVSHQGVFAGVFSSIFQADENARRRERDLARARRDGAQQPIDHAAASRAPQAAMD